MGLTGSNVSGNLKSQNTSGLETRGLVRQRTCRRRSLSERRASEPHQRRLPSLRARSGRSRTGWTARRRRWRLSHNRSACRDDKASSSSAALGSGTSLAKDAGRGELLRKPRGPAPVPQPVIRLPRPESSREAAERLPVLEGSRRLVSTCTGYMTCLGVCATYLS